MSSAALQKKVGQLFAVGFHGQEPSTEIKTLIHEYGIGGVVLFKRNIADVAQLRALTLALQREARLAGHTHPLFIGIDQENGWVTRISPPMASQLPGPMALGATNSPDLAYKVGMATGQLLKHVGVNMNYGPVCDINSEPLNPVIGVRSPGDDPEFVGRFASAIARGQRQHNIISCVKHFPGHGDTATDSHYGLPVISKTRDQLERCELVPFRRATAEGIEAVMTAHISLPGLGNSNLPATLSPEVLRILRTDMNYDGMIITDCLEMDGIRATYGTEEGSVLALAAGSDSFMICHTYGVQVASVRRVCEAVGAGRIPMTRLEEAYRHVTQLKQNLLSWEEALRVDEAFESKLRELDLQNRQLADAAYARSVTVVRDDSKILPVSVSSKVIFLFPGDKIPSGGAVDGEGLGRVGSYNGSVYFDVLKRHNPNVTEIRYGEAGLSTEEWRLVEAADVVILTTINARESPFQRKMGRALPSRARALISIAACSPYDFLDEPTISTYITTYEPTLEAFTVAVSAIFGAAPATGRLPVGTKEHRLSIELSSLDDPKDLEQVHTIWNAALPTYPLPLESFQKLLPQPHGHHFVARTGNTIVGFCLTYTRTTNDDDKNAAYLSAIAVTPTAQNQGIGNTLIQEAIAWYTTTAKPRITRLDLSSSFPRFWPGLPDDLPPQVTRFFETQGFTFTTPPPRHVDLYRTITDFQLDEKHIAKAQAQGYTFAPLQPDQYEECIAGQRKNFSHNQAWVQTYITLHPRTHPNSIMTAFDPKGHQIGWTLMLDPSSSVLQSQWALPPACSTSSSSSSTTGLIGCVGVDAEHRGKGVGVAMLAHALAHLRGRGVHGVMVDWVVVEGFYESLGFEVWRAYRLGSARI
ncbi:putative beta-N-acetylglucosaminidase [Aspergillus homomorphus CBS 101889]|uniref:Glycoside hydrolase n=1 Tax=Aspergillus homomorphus (strain CBS 101889) TaxID=1450537 RepID=A0A395I592_ASPHC|nr:glycoside hydrolase [Aspergillus homomorphus CBS 101889]RAL15392.1 glycoside hydrolase [Aspergillus homomorphus CBS 101889]